MSNSGNTNSTGSEPNWGACQSAGAACSETGGSGIVWTAVGAPCANIRADNQWNNATAYLSGDTVIAGVATGQVFQAMNNGTSGSSFNFNACPAYGNCGTLDNGIQWASLGGNDCRADIVLVDLTSAHR